MTVPWRRATAPEIRQYYRETFPQRLDALPDRVTPPGPLQYGLALAEPYPTVGDEIPSKAFLRRHSRQTTRDGRVTSVVFEEWETLLEWIQAPASADPLRGVTDHALADPMVADAPRPVPEAVYYSVQHHDRPWVVLLDIDAKDIAANRDESAEAIKARDPTGYDYAFEDVDRAIEYGFDAERILQTRYDADDTQVYYTGQGVHVYLLDTDELHQYDRRSRAVLVDLFQEIHDIPVDGVVTSDPARFGRLPYTLHTDVSRIVTPLESTEFDPRTEAAPPSLESAPDADPTTESVGDRA